MENNVNAKIKSLINFVYGESFSEAHLKVLLEKIDNAGSVITGKRKAGWDEKDIVLITYADQFSAPGEKALPVFTRFYNEWLSRIFCLFTPGLLTMVFPSSIIMKLHLKRVRGVMSRN